MHSVINAMRRCFHHRHTPANVQTIPPAHGASRRSAALATPDSSGGTDAASSTRNWAAAQSAQGRWGTRPLAPGARGTRPGDMRTAEEMQASENKKRQDKFRTMEKSQAIAREIGLQNVKDVKKRMEGHRPATVGITTEPVRKTTFFAHKQRVINAFVPPAVIVDTNGSRVHRDPRTSDVPKPPPTTTPKDVLEAVAVAEAAEVRSRHRQVGGDAPIAAGAASAWRPLSGVQLATIPEGAEPSAQ